MDVGHDVVQALVDFFGTPRQAHGILTHFQTRDGYAAGVAGLARRIQRMGFKEHVYGVQRGGHVGTFSHGLHAIGHQRPGVLGVELVLGGAGQGDVHRHMPRSTALLELQATLGSKGRQATALDVLQLEDGVQHFAVDAALMDEGAFGVGHGQHAGAQFQRLERGVLGHVARARDGHPLVAEVLVDALEHFQGEVHHAVAGGLGADEAAAEGHALAGEDAAGMVGQLLVHAVEEAHLTAAHADVAGRHVGVGADVTEELHDERLAETHHLTVALAFGIEVGAALATAHGQGGQCVLEGLLEGQELQDGQVDRGVKAQAALVGANGGVVLDPPCAVDLDFTLVVDPADAELDDAVGFDETLQQAVVCVAGVFLEEGPEAVHDFLDGLQEFGLLRIAPLDHVHEVIERFVFHGC